MNMTDKQKQKWNILRTCPRHEGAEYWSKRFATECELVGPQSWRRFLPGLYWISKRHGPRPTKEWRAFVHETELAVLALSELERQMLCLKLQVQLAGGLRFVCVKDLHLAEW